MPPSAGDPLDYIAMGIGENFENLQETDVPALGPAANAKSLVPHSIDMACTDTNRGGSETPRPPPASAAGSTVASTGCALWY